MKSLYFSNESGFARALNLIESKSIIREREREREREKVIDKRWKSFGGAAFFENLC